jgi:hypothetical protein
MGDTVLTKPTTPVTDAPVEDQWTSNFLKIDRSILRRRGAISLGSQGTGTKPTPPPVPPRPKLPPGVLPTATKVPLPIPPRPLANARNQNATNTAQTQAVTGPSVLAGLPDSDAANRIRDIVAQHAQLVPTELAVFKGIEYLDDVARITNPDERTAKLEKINEVLTAVDKRRQELRAALKEFPAPQPEAATKSITAGWSCFQSIADHLPAEFQRMNGGMATERVKTLMATDEEKANMLAEAKQGFKDKDGNDISATLGETFKGVIEPVSTKSFERQNFYFDQFVASPPQEQIQKLIAVTDTIVAQGQKILDAGGKIKDVEDLMVKTGIPKDWWPPQFVDTLQAWRKTERAMAQERVSAQFGKKQAEGVDMKTQQGFTDFFCSTVPDQADAISKIMGQPEVAKSVADFMGNIEDGYGLGALGLTALQTLNFDELPKTDAQKLKDGIEKSMNLIASAVDTTVSALDIATSAGATIISTVVPGLSLVSAGIKLGLALKKLAEHTAIRVQTGMMKDDAVKALGNRMMEDGGAFLKALDNESNGRNKQIVQDGVEVFAAGSDLAGSAAGSFGGHYGLAAQGVLKVTSTAVTMGSKVIFTNINWGEAKKAKAMLLEAQAGNPVARMEIFKNSNLYAKMYICVLCKEGNPLAKKFVVQRGIEEEDLDGAMSLKVLREAMLESADQKDENDIEDNWLLENMGAVGKGMVGMVAIGKKVALLGGSLDDLVRKNRNLPYDPNWAPTAADITEVNWKSVKAEAIKAGLYDEKTGIGDALASVDKKLEKADDLLNSLKTGTTLRPDSKEGKAAQKLLLETVTALDAAYGAAFRASPMSNPAGKPAKAEVHKGMVIYLGMLMEKLGTKRAEVETALRGSGLKNVDWQPGISSNPLDATAWDINWEAGVKAACLPDSDSGLSKAMAANTKAKAAYEKAEGGKKRDAALAYSDTLNQLVAAGKECLGDVGEVRAMAAYVQKIISTAGSDRVALDKILGATAWNPTIPPAGSITAAAWTTLWGQAVTGGYVSAKAGDGGMADAIKTMVRLQKAVESAADGKPKLKARMDFAKAAGEILLAKEDFFSAQRDVGKPLKDFIENTYKQANDIQIGFSDARTDVAFTTTPGTTKEAWDATYKAAIDAGALPAAKSAAKAFHDALSDYASKKDELDKAMVGKKYKDALKLAQEVKKTIDEALSAIDSKLMASDGYAKHKIMGEYLKTERAAVKDLHNNPVLVRALSGDAAGTEFKAPDFTFDDADFSKVKASAITLGVIADQKTGMQAALKAREKSAAALAKAKTAPTPDPEAVKKATETALNDAKVLRSVAGRLRGLSKNANWGNYAESAVVKATEYQRTLM